MFKFTFKIISSLIKLLEDHDSPFTFYFVLSCELTIENMMEDVIVKRSCNWLPVWELGGLIWAKEKDYNLVVGLCFFNLFRSCELGSARLSLLVNPLNNSFFIPAANIVYWKLIHKEFKSWVSLYLELFCYFGVLCSIKFCKFDLWAIVRELLGCFYIFGS